MDGQRRSRLRKKRCVSRSHGNPRRGMQESAACRINKPCSTKYPMRRDGHFLTEAAHYCAVAMHRPNLATRLVTDKTTTGDVDSCNARPRFPNEPIHSTASSLHALAQADENPASLHARTLRLRFVSTLFCDRLVKIHRSEITVCLHRRPDELPRLWRRLDSAPSKHTSISLSPSLATLASAWLS
jgi:hypothetical protein